MVTLLPNLGNLAVAGGEGTEGWRGWKAPGTSCGPAQNGTGAVQLRGRIKRREVQSRVALWTVLPV